MLRNLPHIAGLAFNQPLLLEPAYARVFFCALAEQMGIAAIRDATGESLATSQELAAFQEHAGRRDPRPYSVAERIAVIPISGTLVSKTRSVKPYSGMTGYNGIVARLNQAMADPEVDGVLLDMDTPGGMVAGAFDCADVIARMRAIKPIWSLANDMHCSAGQLIASAASHRLITQTARTGSIGVMMAHSNYAGAMAKEGVEITLLYSGQHKVEGNPYSALPDSVREQFQAQMDMTRQRFAEKVACYTGLSVDDVLATEAAVYAGVEVLDIGLADQLVINSDAIGVMREALTHSSKTVITGGVMQENHSADNQPTEAAQSVAGISAEQLSAAVADAVAAENARIMGILGCEEANGREAMAQVLAKTPSMTVEDARRIMAAAPLSAQARSETALDDMMRGAPAPVTSASVPVGADDNDLLAIPV